MATAEVPTNGNGEHPQVDEPEQPAPAPPESKAEAAKEPPKEEGPKRPPMSFGKTGVILTNLNELWQFAKVIYQSGMAPRGFETVEKITVGIQFGAEFGIAPLASLRSVAVIEGTPGWKGDMALALVRSSGKLARFKKWHEGEGMTRKAFVLTQRVDDPEPMVTSFSVDDAVLAGLWGMTSRKGEPMPWKSYPDRMLYYRALGFNLRDNFPEVMLGTHTAEELADRTVDVTPTSAETIRPGPAALNPAPPPDPLLSMISRRKVSPPAEAITGKSGPPLEERFVLVDPAAPADPDLTGALKASLAQRAPKKGKRAAKPPTPVNDCTHPDIKPSDIPAGEVRRCPRCTEELHRDPLPPQIA